MQAGTVLDGRYRLIQPIGAGGFGQVWKAHDPRVDRKVAVKVLAGDGGADHDRQVARFAREAAVAGGLSHPNIVTVHDFGSAMYDGRLHAYLVMQLLPGKSLSAVLEAGRFPLSKAMYTAACVADALEAAHEAGLTHRDIKPSNIIVRSSGEATVVDFGITRSSDARHDITTTGVLIGTPAYMAPEALSGTFDYRSDMYSLGCVLYEMGTGQRPFTGASWRLVNQHLNEQPAPLRTLRPDAPAELERLVSRLMAKDPAQRPASADVWATLKEINDRYFGSTPPSRGKDIAHDIDVTSAEAADGAVIPLRITAHKPCPACATRTDEKAARACTTCKGEGRLIREQHTYKVRIPAGIRDGQKVRLRELGGPGKHGGAPGDMYVTVHVID
ncbi:protein kinase domain-containing protein [Streptomyces afghaniensis]|uniref:protein kinase domain-containing protein n=1 Tax=Streptomyces afghaniensis TaxID=66865 RepID=UPI002789EF2A|nr:protein kinase [Streptomyces afghaniensis]MDQ1013525.1 serine/threonine protein kinase [Streptomyces afghaniensis]